MTINSKSLKREIAFNIDKVYRQFYAYTSQLKKNRLIDLYHSLFCSLPSSALAQLSHLDSGVEYKLNKSQRLVASGVDGVYEGLNLFEASLYECEFHHSFNNEKIVLSLEFSEEIIVDSESCFRFYLQHDEAINSVAALAFF
ncbi:hypothetical protein [Piscirickettsia litoralis]|uniref:Uncharacterized protein n=1 Tax=Piscirickettsia litoralis TaxID=1891921 RepID=A0ABX3A1Z2_9GAMM|nr:hypothetical protein [Piscirickettsia litoralis]ODN41648.1 hypothetical protein BGC07_16280 [Piscirickettsia litoralis]